MSDLVVFRCRIWPHVIQRYRNGIDRRHYFQVRIYGSAGDKWTDYQKIAKRYTDRPIHYGEKWQACVLPVYRGNGNRSYPLFGILFGERGWITEEVVAHEAVHLAASLIRNISLALSGGRHIKRVDLGRNCRMIEEQFAYITSSAVKGITEGLFRTGVWK